jgi:tryptophan-rich sensory protein
MDPENVWDFVSWLLLVFIFGFIALLVCCWRKDCYSQIKKPYWYPTFTCSTLLILLFQSLVYILLAWSAYRIWSDGGWDNHTFALSIFVINIIIFHIFYFIYYIFCDLFILFLWSILFCLISVINFVIFIIEDLLAGLLLLPFCLLLIIYAILLYKFYCLNHNFHYCQNTKCPNYCQNNLHQTNNEYNSHHIESRINDNNNNNSLNRPNKNNLHPHGIFEGQKYVDFSDSSALNLC